MTNADYADDLAFHNDTQDDAESQLHHLKQQQQEKLASE